MSAKKYYKNEGHVVVPKNDPKYGDTMEGRDCVSFYGTKLIPIILESSGMG